MTRDEYQIRIISEAGYDPHLFDLACQSWWFNATKLTSYRLTQVGRNTFTNQFNQAARKIELDTLWTGKQLLLIEKHFTSPYYICPKSLTVFSEIDAMMLIMNGGDIAAYLNSF